MTATILDHPRRPTWANVRERHDRALQMQEQTVEAFAVVGDMLIALKAETPEGEFLTRCIEPHHPVNTRIDSRAARQAAWERSDNYMRLASSRDQWEPQHPASLRQALKLIAPPKQEKVFKVGWAAYLRDRLGA